MTVKKTKVDQIKALTVAGATERTISAALDIPKTTVHQLIHKSFTADELVQFRTAEASVLATKRAEILNSIDLDDIKGSSLLQRATTYAIMYDKQALMEGKATSIIGYDPRSIAKGIAELRQMVQSSNDNDVIDVIE